MTFEQFCDPEYRRALQIKIKSEATWVAFQELQNLINVSALSRQYFNRSPAWLTQRINNNKVFGKPATFNEAEYHRLAEAFRHIAKRLVQYADEIDAAELESGND